MTLLEATSKNLHFSYREIQHPELLEYAKNKLSNQGILKKSNVDSYYYLKIEDDYILKLFPMIQEDNISLPDYFSPDVNTGAHISVIYENEIKNTVQIEGLEQTFQFDVSGLLIVEVFKKRFYALTVISPHLEQLRNQHNLDSRLNYRGLLVPFHITIAVGWLDEVVG